MVSRRELHTREARPPHADVLSVDHFSYSLPSKQRGSALFTSRLASISHSLLQTLLCYLAGQTLPVSAQMKCRLVAASVRLEQTARSHAT